MDLHPTTLPAAIGAALAGGFFAGLLNDNGKTFALIVAPKDGGERPPGAWNGSMKAGAGAGSYSDGLANTIAMAEAGSELGQWARELSLADHSDWYIPSRDELELMYRDLKPTTRENYASFRDGENPSSSPAGYPYTETTPSQTPVNAFQDGGAEALAPAWYWSSTQHASGSSSAWGQNFSDGDQFSLRKSYEGRARAVRRFAI